MGKKIRIKMDMDHLNTLRDALDAYDVKMDQLQARHATLEGLTLRTRDEIIQIRRAIIMATADEEQG